MQGILQAFYALGQFLRISLPAILRNLSGPAAASQIERLIHQQIGQRVCFHARMRQCVDRLAAQGTASFRIAREQTVVRIGEQGQGFPKRHIEIGPTRIVLAAVECVVVFDNHLQHSVALGKFAAFAHRTGPILLDFPLPSAQRTEIHKTHDHIAHILLVPELGCAVEVFAGQDFRPIQRNRHRELAAQAEDFVVVFPSGLRIRRERFDEIPVVEGKCDIFEILRFHFRFRRRRILHALDPLQAL